MNYSYFVSYSYQQKDGLNGQGMVNIYKNDPIESYLDVVQIANDLAKKNDFATVIINNYIKLEK